MLVRAPVQPVRGVSAAPASAGAPLDPPEVYTFQMVMGPGSYLPCTGLGRRGTHECSTDRPTRPSDPLL